MTKLQNHEKLSLRTESLKMAYELAFKIGLFPSEDNKNYNKDYNDLFAFAMSKIEEMADWNFNYIVTGLGTPKT